MAQVRVALSIAPVDYPPGTLLGTLRARLLTSAGLSLMTKNLAAPFPEEVVFDGVSPGSYTFEAQQMTSNSIPIGGAFTTPVVVQAPQPVQGSAVVGATVTVI